MLYYICVFYQLIKLISMSFLYLPSIISIDLSFNQIGYIYKYAFYRLCNEEVRHIRVSLSGNRLRADAVWKLLSITQVCRLIMTQLIQINIAQQCTAKSTHNYSTGKSSNYCTGKLSHYYTGSMYFY